MKASAEHVSPHSRQEDLAISLSGVVSQHRRRNVQRIDNP
jgi:hypothetical protein